MPGSSSIRFGIFNTFRHNVPSHDQTVSFDCRLWSCKLYIFYPDYLGEEELLKLDHFEDSEAPHILPFLGSFHHSFDGYICLPRLVQHDEGFFSFLK